MRVRFALSTKFCFSEPVNGHVFRLRPVPPELSRQHVESFVLRTNPEVKLSPLTEPVLGNLTWTGRIDAPHEAFEICCEGVVALSSSLSATNSLNVLAQDESAASGRDGRVARPAPYFVRPTALTMPGQRLLALWESLRADVDALADVREKALFLMHAVHRTLSYQPGSTTTQTTAEKALEIGSGVCQDYSHVLIALLRLAGIPALYAAGLVEGVGATHAWVEAWTGEKTGGASDLQDPCGCRFPQMLALDPTHDVEACGTYVVLARGCDFADAALERGIFRGRASQSIVTRAEVVPLGDGTD